MRPRGLTLTVAALVLASSTFLPASASTSAAVLRVFVPGTFSGCTAQDPSASPSFRALMDLVRPSAFTPNQNGRLVGQGGPIATAELVSLVPQTVVYTIDPTFRWSNGVAFRIADLRNAIAVGQSSTASWADGYHSIARVLEGPKKLTLRVVFGRNFSDWPNLFRDVEWSGVNASCEVANVATRPSLGPYRLISITSREATLVRNTAWPSLAQQYQKVELISGSSAHQISGPNVVDYRYQFSLSDVMASSSTGRFQEHIGPANQVIGVVFSPNRALTSDLSIRSVLSWAVPRQQIINNAYGRLTYMIDPSRANLSSQGVAGYLGGSGISPVSQMTTTTVPASSTVGTLSMDCVACALAVLKGTPGVFGSQRLGWSYRGIPLRIRLAVGSGPYVRQLADAVADAWTKLGIGVFSVQAQSNVDAALMAADGQADAAVVLTPIGAPGSVAAAWYGTRRSDTVDAGWRTATNEQIAAAAEGAFNPTSAGVLWQQIDSAISAGFWQRPIAAIPYFARWDGRIAGVNPTSALDAFINEIPTWSAP